MTPRSGLMRQASCLFRDFVSTLYMPHALTTRRAAHQDWGLFRNHLFPVFGDMRLDEIKKADIALFMQQKKQAGYMTSTCNRLLARLKASLAYAQEIDLITPEQNPARGFRQFRQPPHRDRFLSREEAQRLILEVSASGSPMLKFIIPFLLVTGARKSEAIMAEWSHVDFNTRTWMVPISKNGRPRFIPLSDGALILLEKVRAFTLKHHGENKFIFPNMATGKPYTQIFYPWDVARRKAGLADVRIHDLRHSFASALVNEGMTLYDVKELLGHANIATTQRYAHLSRERLMEAASKAGTHYGLALA